MQYSKEYSTFLDFGLRSSCAGTQKGKGLQTDVTRDSEDGRNDETVYRVNSMMVDKMVLE